MSRKDFEYLEDVALTALLLDEGNPRIRAAHDQRACIERILRKEDHMVNLMKDIANRGLTTMPIIVMPTGDGRYKVMDGNRRVTALKLLNFPDSCPDERLKPLLKQLLKEHRDTIPETVDVMSSADPKAVSMEVLARHSGAQDGVGQVEWSAYLRNVYLINHGHPPDYKRAAQYALWAEDQGIDVSDEFPISSLHRFFTAENLALLGFRVDKVTDELEPAIAAAQLKQMAQIVMTDFLTDVRVDDVRTPTLAQAYIKTVRNRVGLTDAPNPTTTPGDSGSSGSSSPTGDAEDAPALPPPAPTPGLGGSPARGPLPPATPRAAPTPATPASERDRLFGRSSPGISIPGSESKAVTIVAEIRKLKVRGDNATPLAVGMLLRHLIELSNGHYVARHTLPGKLLGKSVFQSAQHMKAAGLLDESQCDIVCRLADPGISNSELLHIETLQKWMHRETHVPSYQALNIFWDAIAPFVRACWAK
jgi:hypothetical protein